MGRKGQSVARPCTICGVHIVWPLLLLCALVTVWMPMLETSKQQTANVHRMSGGVKQHEVVRDPSSAEPEPIQKVATGLAPASVFEGVSQIPIKTETPPHQNLKPAAEIATAVDAGKSKAAEPSKDVGNPRLEEANGVVSQESGHDAAPLEALPHLVLRDLGEAGRSDFLQAMAAVHADGAPAVPPVTTPAPQALQTTEFLSMIRIQKTASKTLQGILMWLAADAFSRGDKRSTRNRCATSFFSTSDVPLATEVQAALEAADENGRSDLLADPFAAQATQLKPPAVEDGGWPASLSERWYKGAPLPGRKTRACASFDEGEKAVRGTHCPFLHAQHMHIADVEGDLAKHKQLGVDKVRLVAAVRHPSRRVQSEFKHVANHGPGLWDYCHVAQRQKLQGGYRSAKFGAMTLTDFLAADAHAFGMRNRQVKMISGLATEPVRALPAASWAGYPGDDTGRKLIEAEHHQGVGAPSKEYQEWAADALALAKWRLATMEGVLVAERLAESLAVLMVHFSWVPLLGDKTANTPRGQVVEPRSADELKELIKKREETPKEFKRMDLHVLTLGLERFGKNLDYTVHVDWSDCAQRSERVQSSGQKWTSKPQARGAAAAAVGRRLGGEDPAAWGVPAEPGQGKPTQAAPADAEDAAALAAGGAAANGGGAMPETEAGLSAWDMLVCVSSHMADQFREMDRTDKLELDFQVEGQLQDRLLSLNELDTALHTYAVELLDARVEHAKTWLTQNSDWIAEAVHWGNEKELPAAPVAVA